MSADSAGTGYDVVVVGGGPAGSTAARAAAAAGLRTVVLEQARHPRFHIGESFLPRNLSLLEELGLAEGLRRLPHTHKEGASFAFAHETEVMDFHFANGLLPVSYAAFNVERAPFDAYLLEAASEAGAEIRQEVTVREVLRLERGAVAVATKDHEGREATVEGRYLLDASGQSTLVGRHLATRHTLSDLKKVAYYGHFSGVERRGDVRAGYPLVVLFDEGWFWFIPIDATRTSVGLVLEAEAARGIELPAKEILFWGLERCPLARRWTRDATFPAQSWVAADFSYTCRPYAGPGYFLLGDAATFVDPIFSTGVFLGMAGGLEAAQLAASVLAGELDPEVAARRYDRQVESASAVFFRLVRRFYRHSFRELFLHGVGPLGIHRAVTSILSGHVWPRPTLGLRWRLRAFELLIELQRLVPLVPRRERFSLLAAGNAPAGSPAPQPPARA